VSFAPDSGTGRRHTPDWEADRAWPLEVSSYAVELDHEFLLFDPLFVPGELANARRLSS
jgi:hypothetical protein